MRTAIFSIFLLSISSLSFASGVYKWTDENGVIHYSDKKPDFKASSEINVQTGSQTKDRQSLQDQDQKLNDQQELERLREQQASENAVAAEEQKEICKTLKSNLETLNNSARIRQKQEDGTERFMTPEEILQQRKDTQARVDKECGGQ